MSDHTWGSAFINPKQEYIENVVEPHADELNQTVESFTRDSLELKISFMDGFPKDSRFAPNMTVRHFKRELAEPGTMDYLYKIIGVGLFSEDKSPMMIYQALYGDKQIYIRPYEMFCSPVDKEKYPDIKQKYRFEKEY